MIGRVRYDDPAILISETADGFMIRVRVSRDAVGQHLEVLEAVLRGTEALLMLYRDPIDPEDI
jgi:hypothetical protein